MLIILITTRVRLLEGHSVHLLESSDSKGWMFPHEIGSRTTQVNSLALATRTLTTHYELVALNSLHRRTNKREIKHRIVSIRETKRCSLKSGFLLYSNSLQLISLSSLSLILYPYPLFILLLYTVLNIQNSRLFLSNQH